MKTDEILWHQHICSLTLKELFYSITDAISNLSSESSFAHELLNEVNQGEFINRILSLSRRIKLYKKISTGKHTNQPGKVYVFDVKVKCQGNHIIVVKEVNAFLYIF